MARFRLFRRMDRNSSVSLAFQKEAGFEAGKRSGMRRRRGGVRFLCRIWRLRTKKQARDAGRDAQEDSQGNGSQHRIEMCVQDRLYP